MHGLIAEYLISKTKNPRQMVKCNSDFCRRALGIFISLAVERMYDVFEIVCSAHTKELDRFCCILQSYVCSQKYLRHRTRDFALPQRKLGRKCEK